ncbi:MAG TPA: hypothetical protein VN803_08900 [Gemmatimonadales bacterium]|nr:hypothetical protein [Gemmatimonadales bacterium]
MTVQDAATYLTAQCPETGTWTVDRVRKVVAYHRFGSKNSFTEGHIAPAIGEPEDAALVNNVTDSSVTRYRLLLRSPFDGTTTQV